MVVDCLFDDSRMFDVIHAARRSRLNARVSIVCVCTSTSRAFAMPTLEQSLPALGACQVVDLSACEAPVGARLLRIAVAASLAAGPGGAASE